MKQFLSFVRKEFHHIFRDVRTMMIIIGIPVAQILIIGFALSTDVKNVKMAVYDPSNDVSTRHIIQQLDASESFQFVQLLKTPEEADALFKADKINFAVIFGDRFNANLYHTGEASIQFLADASDPNSATVATAYATSIVAGYQQELMREMNIPVRIIPQTQMLYNPGMQSSYNFVPGLMGLILILICAMMTSIAIVREKETGTMEVLLTSPVKPVTIVIAKMTPYFILSWFILIVILLMSVFLLHVPITGNLIWLNVFSLIFIILSLALGLLISTLVNTQVAALLASGMGLMMPIMILSGMMFPIESMPVVLQWISSIVPARWFISGVRKVMIEGAGVSHIWTEMLILIGMAVAIITISLRNFKTRLE
ncbi:MAG: Inner membrane transport permease YbhR [Candidatus Ordinivivax streblomastigis]|uniref:Transport permease protein n=1 Tax=Candidatus Ordinivivax streblomastigis TaxID=2540710 RepID=A0A5M8P363_9BACT|nr:MAG: Inner membrane transport permease YbhR [Candidatus Ordinivivax streblomastigis]